MRPIKKAVGVAPHLPQSLPSLMLYQFSLTSLGTGKLSTDACFIISTSVGVAAPEYPWVAPCTFCLHVHELGGAATKTT